MGNTATTEGSLRGQTHGGKAFEDVIAVICADQIMVEQVRWLGSPRRWVSRGGSS